MTWSSTGINREPSVQARRALAYLTLAGTAYPFLLQGFHVSAQSTGATAGLMAAVFLIAAFAMPAVGLLFASRLSGEAMQTHIGLRVRRFAYFTVTVPTLYVFFGVLWYMAGIPVADTWVWPLLWLAIALGVRQASEAPTAPLPASRIARWRVAHGIGAVLALAYILFHVTNHLFGLVGPEAHAAVMHAGRAVYRAQLVEPLLVLVMLFQVVTGVRLAWFWSARPVDAHRTYQIATGFYLSLFIVGHMNSVFDFARLYLGIDTNWDFAIGAPTGIVHDAWNIRLLPHYALGVFFVLSHVASGLRVILRQHGLAPRLVDGLWMAVTVTGALVALGIALALTGFRLPVTG